MQEPLQLPVADRVMRSVYGFVVLAEELGPFLLGEVTENYLGSFGSSTWADSADMRPKLHPVSDVGELPQGLPEWSDQAAARHGFVGGQPRSQAPVYAMAAARVTGAAAARTAAVTVQRSTRGWLSGPAGVRECGGGAGGDAAGGRGDEVDGAVIAGPVLWFGAGVVAGAAVQQACRRPEGDG